MVNFLRFIWAESVQTKFRIREIMWKLSWKPMVTTKLRGSIIIGWKFYIRNP